MRTLHDNRLLSAPMMIVAAICIAPIFIIAEGSKWIKLHYKQWKENQDEPKTICELFRKKKYTPPCFKCQVNGLDKQCQWCENQQKRKS